VHFIDGALYAQVKKYAALTPVFAVPGAGGGAILSDKAAFGHEFLQHNIYSPGGDLRHIDWKVYARRDRLYLKKYHTETSLRCVIGMDASASMAFASKWDFARTLACATALLLAQSGARCGFFIAGESVVKIQPGEQSALERFDETLYTAKCAGANSPFAAPVFPPSKDTPHLIFTDMQQENFQWPFVGGGAVIHIIAAEERSCPWNGRAVFSDMETGEELACGGADITAGYEREFALWLKQCAAAVRARGVHYVPLYTDMTTAQAFEKIAAALWR